MHRKISQEHASPTFHSILLKTGSVKQIKSSRHDYGYIHSISTRHKIVDITSVRLRQRINIRSRDFLRMKPRSPPPARREWLLMDTAPLVTRKTYQSKRRSAPCCVVRADADNDGIDEERKSSNEAIV